MRSKDTVTNVREPSTCASNLTEASSAQNRMALASFAVDCKLLVPRSPSRDTAKMPDWTVPARSAGQSIGPAGGLQHVPHDSYHFRIFHSEDLGRQSMRLKAPSIQNCGLFRPLL